MFRGKEVIIMDIEIGLMHFEDGRRGHQQSNIDSH